MIVDTSALVAYFNSRDPHHSEASLLFETSAEPLVVSPFVIAELDYLVATREGTPAELQVLRELTSGAWDLATFDLAALTQAVDVIDRYADQNIGVADASLVVLADQYQTRKIATLDRRHFSIMRPLRGRGAFQTVP